MSKTKILVMLLAAMVLSLSTTAKTEAAWKGWTEYFTQDEGKAIKKMVDSYIRDSIESKDKRWKDIISGSTIKDDSIDKDKVDDTIAKRKVYTGTFPASEDDADISYTDEDDNILYFKKISVPEADVSNSNVTDLNFYTKSVYTSIGSNVWSEDNYEIEDGYAWHHYATDDNGGGIITWDQFGDEYKIVLSY